MQVGLDWVMLAVVMVFSGGTESPAKYWFLFHIAVTFYLLPHVQGLLYVILAPALVGAVVILEYAGVLPHVELFTPSRVHDPVYVA